MFWLNVASRTPPGYLPHTLATAIGESLNGPSPALKYQRSSYLRAGTARNVTKRTKSMLAETRRLADEVVTLVMRLVSRCILRSEDYLADPLFNNPRRRWAGLPTETAFNRKDRQDLAKIAKQGSVARGGLRASIGGFAYLFSIGTYFDG